MVNLTLEGDRLHIAERSEADPAVSLRLDCLRIVFLFAPETCDWRFVQPAAGRGLTNLEQLSQEDLSDLTGKASALGADAGEFSLFLEDYCGRSASISVADIGESGIDVLGELSRHREARRARLVDWTRGSPGLILTGALGDRVTLDAKGVRAGDIEFMPWRDLDRIEMESEPAEDLNDYHFFPRPGSTSSEFSVRMPGRKAAFFAAEYTFWRSLGVRQAPGPLSDPARP